MSETTFFDLTEQAYAPGRHLTDEQYATPEQQIQTATFGIWVFLASEILFFGALFLSLYVYRFLYPDAFHEGSRELKFWLGTINTGVLMTSSLTMAMAVSAGRRNQYSKLRHRVSATMGLGFAFLCIKGTEYFLEYKEHRVPSLNLDIATLQHKATSMFYFLYFFMTGLHALHMLVGLSLLTYLLITARLLAKRDRLKNRSEVIGLYWHFVDIVWVFLYPSLYLMGFAQ